MQTHNATYFNRYPFLWERIKTENPKLILSFGCSTGEEVITAAGYFPNASVCGYDKNEVMLRIAAMRFGHIPRIYFNIVPSDTLQNPYDMILCNSVLCNHPKNWKAEKNDLMSFERFDKTMKELDSRLNPNGILMAMNTEYIVSDSLNYEPMGIKVNHQVAVFDRYGYKTTRKQFALWRKPIVYV